MYAKGTTLLLDFGIFNHYGIADGCGGVIHNSKKYFMVTHESEADFAEGKDIIVSDITSNNSTYAFNKAKRYIGMSYDLLQSNCEHFVRLCHGLEVESTQIQKYLLASAAAGVAIKSNNSIIKMASVAASLAALFTPKEESPFKNAAIASLVTASVVFLTN